MDWANAWIAHHKKTSSDILRYHIPVPPFICKDGFEISIQGGYSWYSRPAEAKQFENNWFEKYYSVELGYPTAIEEAIASYADDKKSLTDTVYPYVPISIVNNVLEKHGINPIIQLKLRKTMKEVNEELRRNIEAFR